MINKISVKHLIGRELTEKETQAIEWLNGRGEDMSGTIAHLLKAAYLNGRLENSLNSKE